MKTILELYLAKLIYLVSPEDSFFTNSSGIDNAWKIHIQDGLKALFWFVIGIAISLLLGNAC